MPSGYTHCFLTRIFNSKVKNDNVDFRYLLDEKIKYFQVGAIAPDLPYSQLLRPHNALEKIADDFHYKSTNKLFLEALAKLKEMPEGDKKDEAFCFFLGFASHVVADGVIHPFVRDKVGDYEQNSTEHRLLEMRLDVILLNEFTKASGHPVNLNTSDYHQQIKDVLSKDFSHVSGMFAELIKNIYGYNVEGKDVEDWIDDMHDMFGIAEGKFNQYYAWIPGLKDYLYKDHESLLANKEKDLVLELNEAKGRNINFAGRKVHFIDDCIPMFFDAFYPLAFKSYQFVYEKGAKLSDIDFPAINLDTGRSLIAQDGKNLDAQVVYWS